MDQFSSAIFASWSGPCQIDLISPPRRYHLRRSLFLCLVDAAAAFTPGRIFHTACALSPCGCYERGSPLSAAAAVQWRRTSKKKTSFFLPLSLDTTQRQSLRAAVPFGPCAIDETEYCRHWPRALEIRACSVTIGVISVSLETLKQMDMCSRSPLLDLCCGPSLFPPGGRSPT